MQTILVPTDGSESACQAVRYAVAWAKQREAKVLGFHVIDVRLLEGPILQDISASLGTAPYANYQGNIEMILQERGKAALQVVREACDEAGVPCETEQIVGLVTRSIIEKSADADLIILARGGEHQPWLEGWLGSTTESVVRRTHKPVLLTETDTPGSARFLAAYDGTPYAQEALKVAITEAASWGAELHVLSVGDDAEARCDEAREALGGYAESAIFATRTGLPSEEIVRYATDMEIDLLIMGAYGHSKVHELIVGSTTAHVLDASPCPVLMFH